MTLVVVGPCKVKREKLFIVSLHTYFNPWQVFSDYETDRSQRRRYSYSNTKICIEIENKRWNVVVDWIGAIR